MVKEYIRMSNTPPEYSKTYNSNSKVCYYYWLNKWRVKEKVFRDNKIYHLIGDAVYTSDGKLFIGSYQPNSCYEVDTMETNPDIILLCCCPWLRV